MSAAPVSAQSPLDMSRKKYGGVLPDKYYDDIAHCETHTRIGDNYGTKSYTSAMGIYRGTAHRWSGKRNLNGLTARQIVEIADRIAFTGWTKPSGKHVFRVGPFGWGVVRAGCRQTLQYLCKSTVEVVQKYRARACRLWSTNG